VPHDGQIVGDEEVGEVELALKALEQVDDLRLDRDVERRDRLGGHDEVRVERECPREDLRSLQPSKRADPRPKAEGLRGPRQAGSGAAEGRGVCAGKRPSGLPGGR